MLLGKPDVAGPFAGQRTGSSARAPIRANWPSLWRPLLFLPPRSVQFPSQLMAAERSDVGRSGRHGGDGRQGEEHVLRRHAPGHGSGHPEERKYSSDRIGKVCGSHRCLSRLETASFPDRCWLASTQPEGQQGSGATVQAPAAGIISSKTAAVGAPASARGEPLFRIATGGEMELLAETPTKTIARLKTDQLAKVEIVGVGALQGKVRHISTSINAATQLGEIRLFIGRDARLRFGAFGRATIEIARRCGAAVPFSAVLYSPDGTVVQTVRDGRVETRPVTVGLQSRQGRRRSARGSPKARWSFHVPAPLCETEIVFESIAASQ